MTKPICRFDVYGRRLEDTEPDGLAYFVRFDAHREAVNALSAEVTDLRSVLKQLRIQLHASGRRPEECFEMSIIDDALAATRSA